jgi:hypothetical protein
MMLQGATLDGTGESRAELPDTSRTEIDSNPYSLPRPSPIDMVSTRLRVALKDGDVPKSLLVAQGRISAVGRPDRSPLKFIFPFVSPSNRQQFF